jgi:hypothetical protein
LRVIRHDQGHIHKQILSNEKDLTIDYIHITFIIFFFLLTSVGMILLYYMDYEIESTTNEVQLYDYKGKLKETK